MIFFLLNFVRFITADVVYMANPTSREEYVLADVGKVYAGTHNKVTITLYFTTFKSDSYYLPSKSKRESRNMTNDMSVDSA